MTVVAMFQVHVGIANNQVSGNRLFPMHKHRLRGSCLKGQPLTELEVHNDCLRSSMIESCWVIGGYSLV